MEVSSVHSPGREAERPAADHVRQRLEGAGTGELHGRADGVADGEAEQGAADAVELRSGMSVHGRSVGLDRTLQDPCNCGPAGVTW